jgi:hypothetical protein
MPTMFFSAWFLFIAYAGIHVSILVVIHYLFLGSLDVQVFATIWIMELTNFFYIGLNWTDLNKLFLLW